MLDIMNRLKRLNLQIGRRFKNVLLHFALQGDTVECPCCSSKYITFLPAGIQLRANAKCIKCGSLERHRTLWLYLHHKGDLFQRKIRLLHVAPEHQLYKLFSKSNGIEYYPVDLNPEQYTYGVKTQKMDITSLDFEDKFFDVVICNHVLEHIVDDRAAMNEINRVLKLDGWAILNVPIDLQKDQTFEDFSITDPGERIRLYGQKDHVRLYGQDYKKRLFDAGLLLNIIDFVSQFSQNQQFRYGLKPAELIFFCTRRKNV